jgi:hypothetical protein
LADKDGHLFFEQQVTPTCKTNQVLATRDLFDLTDRVTTDGLPELGGDDALLSVRGCTPVKHAQLRKSALASFRGIQAYANMLHTAIQQHRDDRVKSLVATSQQVVDSLLEGLGAKAKLFRCTWDDDDVNNYMGIISLDPKSDGSGEIRVVLGTFTGDV